MIEMPTVPRTVENFPTGVGDSSFAAFSAGVLYDWDLYDWVNFGVAAGGHFVAKGTPASWHATERLACGLAKLRQQLTSLLKSYLPVVLESLGKKHQLPLLLNTLSGGGRVQSSSSSPSSSQRGGRPSWFPQAVSCSPPFRRRILASLLPIAHLIRRPTAAIRRIGSTSGRNQRAVPAVPSNSGSCESRNPQTVRLECLAKFIIFGKQHLDYLITEFVEYYNTRRSHMERGHLPPVRE